MKSASLVLVILVTESAAAAAWEIPPDNGVMGRDAIDAILAGNDYPETGTYTQAVEFIDFTANGQPFTQVVVTLTPDRPRLRNGNGSSSSVLSRAANTGWISCPPSKARKGLASGSRSAA